VNISDKGLELIKAHEGLRLRAYICPAGVWTIGYGHTGDVEPDDEIDEARATEYLRYDVMGAEECVNHFVNVPLTQGQFDALVSFVFNVGPNAFRNSTMLKLINSGNFEAAGTQFGRWNKGGGKVLSGLTKRRQEESELFNA
jgi:lysozyme